jgi:DNA-binding transcriptional MerR regulator
MNKLKKNLKNNKLIGISDLAKKIGLIDKKNGKPLTHTLRFWESKFSQIKPTILSGNRRYYTKNDIEKINLIKFLLKDQGLTIKGAKKIMNNRINNLDDYKSSSIKAKYFENQIKLRSKKILNKIKELKK